MTKTATTKCRLCARRIRQKAGPGRPKLFCNRTCRSRYMTLRRKWSE